VIPLFFCFSSPRAYALCLQLVASPWLAVGFRASWCLCP